MWKKKKATAHLCHFGEAGGCDDIYCFGIIPVTKPPKIRLKLTIITYFMKSNLQKQLTICSFCRVPP